MENFKLFIFLPNIFSVFAKFASLHNFTSVSFTPKGSLLNIVSLFMHPVSDDCLNC